jgi:hypothetical protein
MARRYFQELVPKISLGVKKATNTEILFFCLFSKENSYQYSHEIMDVLFRLDNKEQEKKRRNASLFFKQI